MYCVCTAGIVCTVYVQLVLCVLYVQLVLCVLYVQLVLCVLCMYSWYCVYCMYSWYCVYCVCTASIVCTVCTAGDPLFVCIGALLYVFLLGQGYMKKFQNASALPESLKDKKKMIFGHIKAIHTFHEGYVVCTCVHVCM